MKKILSLLLVGIMVVSMIPTAFATTNYTNGTQVSFNAEADNDGDGQPDSVESYTVTVPAKLAPAGSGDVVAQGTWASNRKLVVTADKDVILTNSINAADEKVLTVTFPGIELPGSNTAAVSDTKVVSVADIEAALFGTWEGVFEYNVEMVDAVELISFTVDVYDEDADDGYTERIYQAVNGMTWGQWVDSKYNIDGFEKSDNEGTVYISYVDLIGVLGETHPEQDTGGDYYFVYADYEIIPNKQYSGIN